MSKSWLLMTLVFLSACSTAIPQPTVTPTAEFVPQVTVTTNPVSINTPVIFEPKTTITPEAELVRINGNSSAESEPFTLQAETQIRVNFITQSDTRIMIKIVNLDPNPADPNSREGVYAITKNPSKGFTDNTLPAGSYKAVVITEGGVWEVWVEKIK